MVGFAGWEMPIQFPTGPIEEHGIVRADAGLFDVSHMGRFWIGGEKAPGLVQELITNDLDRIGPGRLLYSPLCLESGGVIDDITVYRFEEGCLLVANASNRDAVLAWIAPRATAGVELEDRSDRLAQLALQGPRAQERLAPLVDGDLDALGYYHHAAFTVLGLPDVLISRNGYTGEDGFEIYLPGESAPALWDALLDRGVRPVGLAARDTLRMEMCYALYGNELDRETTPLEAGLGWTVKLRKERFIGKEAIERQKREGLRRTLIGFEVEGRRMPRGGMSILSDGRTIGRVTSGGPAPSLGNRGVGLGYVPPEHGEIGRVLAIDVRGGAVEARVVERPFYKNGSHR